MSSSFDLLLLTPAIAIFLMLLFLGHLLNSNHLILPEGLSETHQLRHEDHLQLQLLLRRLLDPPRTVSFKVSLLLEIVDVYL